MLGCQVWRWDWPACGAFAEASSILAAIDQVNLLYPADRTRVAVAGLSAGASMAALLAMRHPDRFKALVMHSGVTPGMAHSTLTAFTVLQGRRSAKALPATTTADTGAQASPPLLVTHGTADATVALSNDQTAAQIWGRAAGARVGVLRSLQRGKRHALVVVVDSVHRGKTVATLAAVVSLGQAWSGVSARQPFSDALGPDASRMVWTFVSRQFGV